MNQEINATVDLVSLAKQLESHQYKELMYALFDYSDETQLSVLKDLYYLLTDVDKEDFNEYLKRINKYSKSTKEEFEEYKESLWHNSDEMPDEGSDIILFNTDSYGDVSVEYDMSKPKWSRIKTWYQNTTFRWAYKKDIFPKEGI